MKKPLKKAERRTKFGRDLEEAFKELAAHLRGDIEVEGYEVPEDFLTPTRIKAIRRKVAEAYEQGRRRPDAAMQTLLKVIDREPAAVRRALAS